MTELAQGQVWIADLSEPIGRRPALLLTRDSAIRALKNVTLATIPTHIRHVDTEVILTRADGFDRTCAVSLDNIITIPNIFLEEYITMLSAERMNEVFEAIHLAFDLPH